MLEQEEVREEGYILSIVIPLDGYMDGSGQLNKARRGYQRHESGKGGNKSSHCLQLAIIYAENSNYLQIITSNKRLQYGGLAQEQCHLHFSI